MANEQNNIPEILPPDESRVQVIEHGVIVHVYRVTEEQLDTLATGGKERTSSIGLLGLFGGTFASFLTSYLTLSDKVARLTADFFIIMCVGSGLLTIVYTSKVLKQWRRPDTTLRQIKRMGRG